MCPFLTINLTLPMKINWNDRLFGRLPGQRIYACVGGTDFRIKEPMPFNPKWYSHKFKGPGLRYEIASCIRTGLIVWWNGSFPCGSWNDLAIARTKLVKLVLSGEKLLADGGYNDGNQYFVTPSGRHDAIDKQMADVRARHETINGLLKKYSILSNKYRGDLSEHKYIFGAIINIVQICIKCGEVNVFQVAIEDE